MGDEMCQGSQPPASVPGRMGRCSSLAAAVRVRTGSTTTTRPLRRRSSRSRPGKSAAVIIEPFDTEDLLKDEEVVGAVNIGNRNDSAVPYISAHATCLGI